VNERAAPILAVDLDTSPDLIVRSAVRRRRATSTATQTHMWKDRSSRPIQETSRLRLFDRSCRAIFRGTSGGTSCPASISSSPAPARWNQHDFMLLSAVTAWQFHPALKNGRPVRFRKTLWVVSQ
jgi:hypothetical protein